MLKTILVFIAQMVLIAFLAFVAREAWIAYEEENLNVRFAQEAHLVDVQVEDISQERKIWKDYIGYSKYLLFHYKGKPYTLRYLTQPDWVGPGTRIALLYDEGLDQFRQPERLRHKDPVMKRSKLVGWSILSTFTYAHRWLFGAVAISVLVGVLSLSILAKLTRWGLLQALTDWIIVLCFLSGAVYITWDTWGSYKYYSRIRDGGQASSATVDGVGRKAYGQNRDNSFPIYEYTADVYFRQVEREIRISSYDYDRFKKGDVLPVVYNASMDEMMAADFSLGYGQVIFVCFLWVLAIYFLRRRLRRPA